MATNWADLLLGSKIGVLHSVCSRTAGRADEFGRSFGSVRNYDRLDEMLEKEAAELDFVYIATPLVSHYDISKKCLEAGVGVLSEKPVTPTLDLWEDLAALAKKKGVRLIEGMWMRCLPTFRQAESWINEGAIGKVSTIRVDFNKFIPSVDGRSGASTGVLMDYGVYALYFSCYFLGGVPSEFHSHCLRDQGGVDFAWAIIARRNGRTAIINMSAAYHGGSGAAIYGEKGMIEWGSPFNRTDEIVLRRHGLGDKNQARIRFPYSYSGLEFQLEEVTRVAKQGLLESRLLTHKMTHDTLRFAGLLKDKVRHANVCTAFGRGRSATQ